MIRDAGGNRSAAKILIRRTCLESELQVASLTVQCYVPCRKAFAAMLSMQTGRFIDRFLQPSCTKWLCTRAQEIKGWRDLTPPRLRHSEIPRGSFFGAGRMVQRRLTSASSYLCCAWLSISLCGPPSRRPAFAFRGLLHAMRHRLRPKRGERGLSRYRLCPIL
jgi:hypothetical protein